MTPVRTADRVPILILIAIAAVSTLASPILGQQASEQEVALPDPTQGLQEIPSLRTENSKHFAVPGGGVRAVLTPAGVPQHWWNGSTWADFDLRLRPLHAGEPGHEHFQYTAHANGLRTLFRLESPDGERVRVEREGLAVEWIPLQLGIAGQELPWGPTRTVPPDGPRVVLSYAGLDQVTSTYTILRNGLKHEVILGALPADNGKTAATFVLTWAVRLEGALTITAEDGRDLRRGGESTTISVQGASPTCSMVIPPPVLRDATGQDFRVTDTGAQYRLRPYGDDLFTLDLTVSLGWLRSSDRRWPVVIDPVIRLRPAQGCAFSAVGSVDNEGTGVSTPYVDWDRRLPHTCWSGTWTRSVSWAQFYYSPDIPTCALINTNPSIRFRFASVQNDSGWDLCMSTSTTVSPCAVFNRIRHPPNVLTYAAVIGLTSVVATGSSMSTSSVTHTNVIQRTNPNRIFYFWWRAQPNLLACGQGFLDPNIELIVDYAGHATANPSVSPNPVCLSDACGSGVQFTANPQDATSFAWNFSDGGGMPPSSTLQNQVVRYCTVGRKTARLSVWNGSSCPPRTYTLTVDVVDRPTASPSASPNPACPSQTIQFTANAVSATSYFWDFPPDGNPRTSTQPDPQVTFSTSGQKRTTLRVDNSCGSNTYNVIVDIAPDAPTASPSASPNPACPRELIQFTANAQRATSYSWDFLPDGNPRTSSQPDPQVTFSSSGQKRSTLRVDNSCGSNTYEVIVDIAPDAPTASPSASPNPACRQELIQFTANAQRATSYSWDFPPDGNPRTSSQPDPQVTFSSTGRKLVTLRVGNSCGNSPYQLIVDIHATPMAAPTAVPNPASLPVASTQGIQFFANATSAMSYEWTFSGGTPDRSTTANPLVRYFEAGEKRVTLTVANSCGETPYTVLVTVHANNPVPRIDTITPTMKYAGDPAFQLTVAGADFVPTSVVLWNGVELQTTFSSTSELFASVDEQRIEGTGQAPVKVFSPGPGGGLSTDLTFTIADPATGAPVTDPRLVSLEAGPEFRLEWAPPPDVAMVRGLEIRGYSVPDRAAPPQSTRRLSPEATTERIPFSDRGSLYFDVVVLRGQDVRSAPTELIKLTYTTRRALGDVTGDGLVDARDLVDVLAAFGTAPGSRGWNPAADCNGDGEINGADVMVISTKMGSVL